MQLNTYIELKRGVYICDALMGGTPRGGAAGFPNKSEQLFFHFGSSQFIFRAGQDGSGGARIARKNALEYALDESEVYGFESHHPLHSL